LDDLKRFRPLVAGSGTFSNGNGHAFPPTVAPTNSFRDLEVWRESMLLVEDVYRLTSRFPRDERFGLTAQIRRAAVSIPSNIGEGARRKPLKVKLNHFDIALGSQGEVDVQPELCLPLGFCTPAEHQFLVPRIERVGRMLNGLITSLRPTENDGG
jgi:four helix bundle protein